MSLYLKNSLNLTLKELNEAESRICFGISFQALAPWYPKDFLQYSRRKRGISKSCYLDSAMAIAFKTLPILHPGNPLKNRTKLLVLSLLNVRSLSPNLRFNVYHSNPLQEIMACLCKINML